MRVWPKGGKGFYKRARNVLKKIVTNGFFENSMTFCVLINTITLALDRYNIPKAEADVLTTFNNAFTYIFIGEMSLKLMAIGPGKYVGDRMNWLDGTVVLLSIVELSFMSGGEGKSSISAFRTVRIFRTFRVLRVARLLRALKSMQTIIAAMQKSMSSFFYIAMLMMLFVFIYALVGMQVFGGKFNYADGKPRGNFDNFNSAFVTVF